MRIRELSRIWKAALSMLRASELARKKKPRARFATLAVQTKKPGRGSMMHDVPKPDATREKDTEQGGDLHENVCAIEGRRSGHG